MKRGIFSRIRWFRLILVAIVAYFGYICFNQQCQLNAIRQERAACDAKMQQARQLNEQLIKERDQLHEPAYIEKLAREQLGLVRKGEVPYVPANKD